MKKIVPAREIPFVSSSQVLQTYYELRVLIGASDYSQELSVYADCSVKVIV